MVDLAQWRTLTHATIAAVQEGDATMTETLLTQRERLLPRMTGLSEEDVLLEARLEAAAIAAREALAAEMRALGQSRRGAKSLAGTL